jgi:2-oxoglutarate ferredoxin oxidoreductase subunit alpha
MKKELFTYLIGGRAGEGVRKAGLVASHLFTHMGRSVFQMDDYQSLIKGGHNFSVISTAPREVYSHYMKADLVVALDSNSYDLHSGHLTDDGLMVFNSDVTKDGDGIGIPMSSEAKAYPNPMLRIGLSGIAILAETIGISKDSLNELITKEYRRDLENNIAFASKMYDIAAEKIGKRFELEKTEAKRVLLTGNDAIALGAAAGGLDIYFAYPMTPATSVLHNLAKNEKKLGLVTVHPENEIAVMNMAVGAASAGARAMVGSSGGGFALMEEAFSLAGMTETPILCILSSRPGPSTGVPTYTAQGDLNFALYQGHGEFPRFVASPGSVTEAFYLTAEMLNLVWRFQTPGILLTEKHLSESEMAVILNPEDASWPEPLLHETGRYDRYINTKDGISPLLFPPSKELIKWNSYDHDELGITSEDPEMIIKMRNKLLRKGDTIIEYMKGIKTINTFGDGGARIFTYGSTTLSVLEAVMAGKIETTVIQPIYLCPLPVWELEKYRDNDNINIIVEQSSTGQFASLLKEKAGIEPGKVIRKYDGRPFEPRELADEIAKVVG